MIDEIIRGFQNAATESGYWRIQKQAEHGLTPAEFAKLLLAESVLPEKVRPWLRRVGGLGGFEKADAVVSFERSAVSEYINFYSDPGFQTRSKSLILGFCGLSDQLMLPIPCVLQFLASEQCDVVVLRDPQKDQYYGGVSGYAHSFNELLQRLQRDIEFRKYRRTFCYGTSMGGTPALRAGLLLGADRAIAVSPALPWHVPRLLDRERREFPAFDPVCECWRDTPTKLLVAFGGAHERDRAECEKLALTLPVRHIVFEDVSSHNLILELARSGRLASFFKRIFAFGRGRSEPKRDRKGWIFPGFGHRRRD